MTLKPSIIRTRDSFDAVIVIVTTALAIFAIRYVVTAIDDALSQADCRAGGGQVAMRLDRGDRITWYCTRPDPISDPIETYPTSCLTIDAHGRVASRCEP